MRQAETKEQEGGILRVGRKTGENRGGEEKRKEKKNRKKKNQEGRNRKETGSGNNINKSRREKEKKGDPCVSEQWRRKAATTACRQ